MSTKEREYFEQRLKTAENAIKTVNQNKKKIKELSWAIEELKDNHKYPNKPNPPSLEYVYNNKIKSLMDKYDKSHKPKEHYMSEGIGWWILFLTLPFVGACFAFFNGGGTLEGMEQMEKIFFIALCVVGPIPVIVFLIDIYLIISYKPRLKHYLKRNHKRLQEIEKCKPEAEKEQQKAQSVYTKKCKDYEIELAKFNEDSEKIKRYTNRFAELKKEVIENEALLTEIFDEIETPKEYRDEHHLLLMSTLFLADSVLESGKGMTAADSFKQIYGLFRADDDENEIAELANRRINREIAKINAEKTARLAAEREKEDRERREKEEAEKIKRWQELDKWWEEVEAQ